MFHTTVINECDGGMGGAMPGGGISGGDMSPGVPSGPGGGITSDAVLGPSGGFEKGKGCFGYQDFHIPFPVMPMLRRWPCCNGGSLNKKKKGKKTVPVKNPYAKGMKTIVAEDENQNFEYTGEAKEQLDRITNGQAAVYDGVLYFNDRYRIAWRFAEDGMCKIYKPMRLDSGIWTVYATTLGEDGNVYFDYKAGKYPDERSALDAIYKAAEEHKKALEEHLRVLAEGFSPRDIMNWEAHGRDPRYFPKNRKPEVNVWALTAELKQKFRGQFADIRLTDLGGTWKVEFSVEGLDTQIAGQRRVKTVVPRVDDIIRLLRIRGVETNQYDVTAVPARTELGESDGNSGPYTFVHGLNHGEAMKILKDIEPLIDNDLYRFEQFDKFEADGTAEYVGLFSENGKCLAMAVVKRDYSFPGYTYVNELQRLVGKGTGERLLKTMEDHYGRLWLMCDFNGGEKLLGFYRRPEFGLEEYEVENSVYGGPVSFFYTKDCDEKRLLGYLDAFYDNGSKLDDEESGTEVEETDDLIVDYMNAVADED